MVFGGYGGRRWGGKINRGCYCRRGEQGEGRLEGLWEPLALGEALSERRGQRWMGKVREKAQPMAAPTLPGRQGAV